ncbi:hypothetical protein CRUP_031132 [Coryphaenoides rupestris]|nr:hypothetical protein CRUP_031132 [Coryphaenoides rupestris]
MEEWVKYTTERKRKAYELHQKMTLAGEHHRRRRQGLSLSRWTTWLAFRKSTQAAAVEKLQKVFDGVRFKRIINLWGVAVKDSKRIKEYLQKLDKGVLEMSGVGEGCDGVSTLPRKLSHKIFQYLEVRDLLRCELVCSAWRAITRSRLLWSRVNFSVEKAWITDATVQQILRKYRPFVTNLNLRGWLGSSSSVWPPCTSIRLSHSSGSVSGSGSTWLRCFSLGHSRSSVFRRHKPRNAPSSTTKMWFCCRSRLLRPS